MKKTLIRLMLITLAAVSPASAKKATESALTLLEAHGARASSLGEAFTAVTNDVTAFAYNPSALSTLKTRHASFSFQRGITDDAYGEFFYGSPTDHGGVGLSLGVYNGGKLRYFDGNTNVEVSAQRDMALGLGWSRRLGNVNFGLTGKYFSSELGGTDKATAYAADFGLGMPLDSRTQLGFAVQNIGTQLKFVEEGENLPRIARVGLSRKISFFKLPSSLLFDVPYSMNRQEISPAIGLETGIGPLAFRAGYQIGSSRNEISMGTGFLIGDAGLDYSFSLLQNVSSVHRVSVSMRFDRPLPRAAAPALEVKPVVEEPSVETVVEPVAEPAVEAVEPVVAPVVAEELPRDPEKVDAATKEKIMIWWRNRYRLGDLDKSKDEWNEIYQKYWIETEAKQAQ